MKKLDLWKKRLEKAFDFKYGVTKEALDFWLRKHGFVENNSSGLTWINRKRRVVIKLPYVVGTKPTKYAVETLAIPIKFSGHMYAERLNELWIQPLCSLEKSIEVAAKFRGMNLSVADLATSNVGTFRRKPVIFDW